MVAASKDLNKDMKYNHHLMNGYYTCDSSLTQGLPESKVYIDYDFCWCNPNFEWSLYSKGQPKRIWGITGNMAYQDWIKQAELGETRVCDGLVAIVDRFHNLSGR